MSSMARLRAQLVEALGGYGPTIVAYSGGVDSAVVAQAAFEALGTDALAVISDSPTLPRSELQQAEATARHIGIPFHRLLRSELDDPQFVANPANRCYFCKDGLVADLGRFAKDRGVSTIALGVNLSDLGDWRPGIQAAREAGARFPLVEVAADKDTVRLMAQEWGLPVWDKPSAPCLSSRIPYGQVVTLEKLGQIERAEDHIKGLGFRDVRVRHFDGVARVEVPQTDIQRLLELRGEVSSALHEFGFRQTVFDERGLVSGRLNQEQLRHP
jgi:pyridinium-3,5-biscarboxylic acid mononucleotide sulfurtransferase